MRFYEFNTPILTEAVGRDLQHVEDVIYIYGPEAALQATKRLAALGQNSKTMTIKYDGCIHPDHILQTNLGELSISKIIDRVNLGEHITVLASDNGQNVMTNIHAVAKSKGSKTWVSVELENSDILLLTEDHEVFTTNRGWVEARQLTPADDIKEL